MVYTHTHTDTHTHTTTFKLKYTATWNNSHGVSLSLIFPHPPLFLVCVCVCVSVCVFVTLLVYDLCATDPSLASRDHIAHVTCKQTPPLTVVRNRSSVCFAAGQESQSLCVADNYVVVALQLLQWQFSKLVWILFWLLLHGPRWGFHYLRRTRLTQSALTDVHFIKDGAKRCNFEVLRLAVVCANTTAPETDWHLQLLDNTGLLQKQPQRVSRRQSPAWISFCKPTSTTSRPWQSVPFRAEVTCHVMSTSRAQQSLTCWCRLMQIDT